MSPSQDPTVIDTAKLNAAIESFKDWSLPSQFWPPVVNTQTLTAAEREMLEAVWEEVSKFDHWNAADLSAAGRVAEGAVKAKYDWLSDAACRQLVNGAAWSWR